MTEQTIEVEPSEPEPTPAETAERYAADAMLAADQAEAEQRSAHQHAALADEARQRDAMLEVADEASAAEAAATHARAYAADAAEPADRIRRLAYDLGQIVIEPSPGGDPDPEVDAADETARIQGAYDQARNATSRASDARYVAEGEAKQASDGVDWLRYHMDGHCQGWRERTSA